MYLVSVVYKLKVLPGKIIKGEFYKQELQKVSDLGFGPVRKLLEKRKLNVKVQYFVKFQRYPEKFDAWVKDVRML